MFVNKARHMAVKVKPKTYTRDAELTRTAILDAAEVEFSRAGLLGARTEDIAENSGVTRGMIHYYYDSKEKLYQAVLARAFSERIKHVQSLNLHEADVEKVLVTYLRDFMRAHFKNTNLPNILLYESVQNDGRYYKDVAVEAIYQPLAQIFERGQKEGVFEIGDPLHTTVNALGACIFYICARNNLRHLFPTWHRYALT